MEPAPERSRMFGSNLAFSGDLFKIEVTEERGDLEEALDSVHRKDERAGAFREQMSLPHSLVLCNAKIFTLR